MGTNDSPWLRDHPHEALTDALSAATLWVTSRTYAPDRLDESGRQTGNTGDAVINVELDRFSGRENDRWDLTAAEASDFIDTLVADLTVVRPLLSIPAVVGPKGFIIRLTGVHATLLGLLGVPTIFRITDLPLDLSYLDIPLVPITPGDSEPISESSAELTGAQCSQKAQTAAAAAAACSLAYTSWNDFSFWNGSRQLNNNCYCYAANYATNNWSGPGNRGGAPLPTGSAYSQRPSATRMTNALLADGWKTSCNGTSLRIVALVGQYIYANGYNSWDYHFMRKNLNDAGANRWCQKGGQGPATNKDYNGNFITSVESAKRNTYSSNGDYVNYNEIIGTFYSAAGVRSVTIA